jgi:hypothetical protein
MWLLMIATVLAVSFHFIPNISRISFPKLANTYATIDAK